MRRFLSGAVPVVIAVGPILSPPTVAAQDRSGVATTLGIGVGLFAEYPSDFSGMSCEEGASGLTGLVRRAVSGVLSLEGALTLTSAIGGATCVADLLPAPQDGETYVRRSLDAGIEGQSFFATTAAVVVDPLRDRSVSPRVRFGGGRLWSKNLWTWVYGAGARFGIGSHAMVLDVERWNLAYDMRRELVIYRQNGPDELQSFEVLRRTPRPWMFRLGWEMPIG